MEIVIREISYSIFDRASLLCDKKGKDWTVAYFVEYEPFDHDTDNCLESITNESVNGSNALSLISEYFKRSDFEEILRGMLDNCDKI